MCTEQKDEGTQGWVGGWTDGRMNEYVMIYCFKVICKASLSLDPNSSRAQAIYIPRLIVHLACKE